MEYHCFNAAGVELNPTQQGSNIAANLPGGAVSTFFPTVAPGIDVLDVVTDTNPEINLILNH